MLSVLEGSSEAVASTVREHVVDRRANNVRAVDPSDPSLIEKVA